MFFVLISEGLWLEDDRQFQIGDLITADELERLLNTLPVVAVLACRTESDADIVSGRIVDGQQVAKDKPTGPETQS